MYRVILCIFLFAFYGCEISKPHSTLIQRLYRMPAGLDPSKNFDSNETQIYSQIYESLVTLDDQLQIKPALAASWGSSDDYRIFTFQLKPGIIYHDGSRVDAASVVHAFNRQITINHTSPLFELIKSIEVVDSLSLTISLSKSYPLFLYNLTSPFGLVAISSNALSTLGDRIAFHPAGTGAFRLKTWTDSEIRLVKYERYYEKHQDVKEIIFRYYPTQNKFFDALNSNELDLLFPVAGYQVDRLKWLGRIEYLVLPPTNTSYIGFNNQTYPFSNPKIRRAFLKAINIRRLAFNLNRGNSIPAEGPLPPILLNYHGIKQDTYDIEEANRILSETSFYSNPTVRLFFPEPAFARHTIIELLKADLSKIGVNLDIKYFKTWEEHNRACKSDSSQLFINMWESDIIGDAENFLYALFYSGSQNNVLNYRNSDVDDWLDEAAITPSVEARHLIYSKIVSAIINDVPAVFLYHVKPHFAYNRLKIKKLVVNPYNIIQYNKVLLSE